MKYIGFLSGRIKKFPEDFIVIEKTNLKIDTDNSKLYYVYKLKKENWNTHDILIKIAKTNQIPFEEIQFGGRKDRYGITTQFITSKKKIFLPDIYKNKVQLEFIGKTDEPMKSKNILENEFIITIREIKENDLPKIQENIEEIKNFGFINYYDSQRFSTFSPITGLPLFYLLEKDYLKFIKLYLTNTIPTESKQAKDRKYLILKNWTNWKYCLDISKTKLEKKVFQNLIANKKKVDILKLLPENEIRFMFSIFQAYIWNLSVYEFLKENIELYNFKTRMGILGFSKKNKIDKEFPLIHKDTFNLPELHKYFEKVFRQIYEVFMDLSYNEKNIKNFLKLSIKNQTFAYDFRKIQVVPKNFEILEIKDDDKNKSKVMKVKFSLESGVYATMLIKRLLARI